MRTDAYLEFGIWRGDECGKVGDRAVLDHHVRELLRVFADVAQRRGGHTLHADLRLLDTQN